MKKPTCHPMPWAGAMLMATLPLHAVATQSTDHTSTIALSGLAEIFDAAPAAARCTAAVCTQRALLVTDDRIDRLIGSGQLDAAALSGAPLIIVNGSGDASATARLARSLGVASPAAVSVHLPSPDQQKLHVFMLEELPEDAATRAAAVGNLLQQVSQWQPAAVRVRRSLQAAANSPQADIPRMEVTVTAVGWVEGNLTTLEATVLRHVTATTSNLRVLMKSSHTLKPYEVIARPGVVRIPDVYRTMHAVVPTGPVNWLIDYVPPTLLGWAPRGSAATSFTIAETHSTSTGFSLSLSPELAHALNEAGVSSPSQKVGFNASFQSSTEHSESLQYQVQDYALGASVIEQGLERWNAGHFEGTHEGAPRRVLEWTHSLAPTIRDDRNYFFGSGVGNPASKITPAMRSLSPQHASSWEVPAHAEMGMELNAGSRIDDVVSLDGYRVARQPSMAHVRARVLIWPSSVWLTREPTVLLRTQSGNGGCLMAATDDRGHDDVNVQPCSERDVEWELGAQWQLDNFQRYYNRGTGKCLALDTLNSRAPPSITLQTCTLAANQSWEWRADRLHNRHDGGTQGYLLAFEHDRVVPVPSAIPLNPHHALMVPWSTYPFSPVQGSFIPSLGGPPQQVPPSWIGLPVVPASARWDLTLLRRPSGG